jgi:two-component system nitrogen regulation response regulator GlnG
MSPEEIGVEQLPIAELMRRRIRSLLDHLGDHRAPELYHRVLREVERVLIEEALARAHGSRKVASGILGIHRNTLRLRMKALGIHAAREKPAGKKIDM